MLNTKLPITDFDRLQERRDYERQDARGRAAVGVCVFVIAIILGLWSVAFWTGGIKAPNDFVAADKALQEGRR
jgi:hypothetical protein